MQNNLISSKIRFVYIAMFVIAILLLLFSLRWQVVEGSKYSQLAQSRFKDAVIPSLRGTIYAADGSTLAYSEPRYNLYAYVPELLFAEEKGLQTREEFVGNIAAAIGIEKEELSKKISESYDKGVFWIKIGEALDLIQREKVSHITRESDQHLPEEQRGGISGYFFEYTAKRIYPEKELASQVLGLTSIKDNGETVGLGGLEGAWDGNLEPIEGFIGGERDAKGNAVGLASERTIEAKRGNSIVTSIDKKIQDIVRDRLKQSLKDYDAKAGSVIVLDPKTGAVIAMANYPDYDPNTRKAKDPETYANKALNEPYEIGSVGKVFTLAAGVDSGVVDPNTILLKDGHNGCIEVHKDLEPVCTHDKLPQPPMPIKDAFALSDNIYFLTLAQEMDPDVYYEYLTKFGVGRPTGIDSQGESFGFIKDWKNWNIGDVTAYSYGHSYQMNALQAISGVSAIANMGVRMQPHFVTKVIEADGSEIEFEPVALERVVKESTVKQMDEMMHVIYQNNIFWWEHQYDELRDYKIAMKSGTALIPDNKGGYSNNYNATYVGYDASPDRSFAMLVRLEDPKYGDLSSWNARPLWLDIFGDIKDLLGVRKIGEF